MPESNPQTERAIAEEVLASLPRDATATDILLAIHQRLSLDDTIEHAIAMRESRISHQEPSRWSKLTEALGCLIPILLVPAFFVAMPLLFSLGEKIVSRPARTVERGVIGRIVMDDGSEDSTLAGRSCRIVSSHVIVDENDGVTCLVPNESYRLIEIVHHDKAHAE